MAYMPKRKLPPIATPKNRETTPAEMDIITTDLAELKELGFVVPNIDVPDEGFPSYTLTPPKGKAMHEWRLALENAGFEVRSFLQPEQLGFAAKRRAAQGKGWS